MLSIARPTVPPLQRLWQLIQFCTLESKHRSIDTLIPKPEDLSFGIAIILLMHRFIASGEEQITGWIRAMSLWSKDSASKLPDLLSAFYCTLAAIKTSVVLLLCFLSKVFADHFLIFYVSGGCLNFFPK